MNEHIRHNRWWEHPSIQIIAVLALSRCIDFIAMALLGIFIPSRWSPTTDDTVSEFVGAVCDVAAVVSLQRLSGDLNLSRIGLTKKRFGVETALGFLVGMAEYLLFMLFLMCANLYVVDKVNGHFPFAAAVLFALSISVGEEVIFRGFIFHKLEARYGTGLALIVSSVIFGAYHIGGGTYGLHYLEAMTAGLPGGLLYASAYLVNRRLWIPIGAHFAWDFFATIFWGWGWGGDNPSFVPLLMDLHLDLHKAPQSILMGGGLGLVESPISIGLDLSLAVLFLVIAVRRGQWKKRNINLHLVYRVDGNQGPHRGDG